MDGDKDAIRRLIQLFLQMNTPKERDRLFQQIQVLYALLGPQFPEKAIPIGSDPDVLDYFLFPFLADFGEIVKDCIPEKGVILNDKKKVLSGHSALGWWLRPPSKYLGGIS